MASSNIISGYKTAENSGQQEHRELRGHCYDQQGAQHFEGDHHHKHHHQHFECGHDYNAPLYRHYSCPMKFLAHYYFS